MPCKRYHLGFILILNPPVTLSEDVKRVSDSLKDITCMKVAVDTEA